MKMILTLGLAGWWTFCLGCSPLVHVARTVIVEPSQYGLRWSNCLDKAHFQALAESAWEDLQKADPEAGLSHDFACGFKEGYADYLYAGGTGNPPPVPPRWYWRAEYETPEGQKAIQDWFAGFRHGAALARQSGYRELVTIPSSVALPRVPPLPPVTLAPDAVIPDNGEAPVRPMPGEELPPPKKRPGDNPKP